MQQIIDFIIRKKDVVVYFILLSLSLALILNSNYFQKSKVLLLSNNISNYTKENLNFFNEYFKLKEVNFQLSEENLDLKNKLEKTNINTGLDSLSNLNF
jgi:rod shape-determining protein MreC